MNYKILADFTNILGNIYLCIVTIYQNRHVCVSFSTLSSVLEDK